MRYFTDMNTKRSCLKPHGAGMSLSSNQSDAGSVPDDVVVRRMVALFDYDPWESSPNSDSEVSASNETLCQLRNPKIKTETSRPAGRARLPIRRHHLRVGGHGPRRVLLRERRLYFYFYSLKTRQRFSQRLTLNLLSGRSSRPTRFGSIELPAAVTLELETKNYQTPSFRHEKPAAFIN